MVKLRKEGHEMAMKVKPQKKETKQTTTKQFSQLELKTKEILHEIIAEYDKLFALYNTHQTAANKRNLENYAYHLANPSRLAAYFLDYIDHEHIPGTSTGDRQVRRIIKEALELGELKEIDGLIRNSKMIPFDKASATGNTITILIPPSHIDRLVEKLDVALVNESAHILVPCKNLIIIIETGDFTNVINDNLYRTVCEVVTDYTCASSFLTPQKPSPSIKIVIN